MSTRALDRFLDEKQRELSRRYKPGFLHRRHTVFQFIFEEGEPFYLTVASDSLALNPGRFETPTITLYIDTHDTCWGLIEGRLDGMQMFMEGRYRADGNIVLSQLLLYLFKSEDDAKFYEVQD